MANNGRPMGENLTSSPLLPPPLPTTLPPPPPLPLPLGVGAPPLPTTTPGGGEGKFVCEICGAVYTRQRHLASHLLTHGEKNFSCTTCGKAFYTKPSLAKHALTHSDKRPYVCDVCSKAFKRSDKLKRHSMIHRGVKFTCQVCGVQCSQPHHLKRHMELHSEEKKSKCEQCGKTFSRQHLANKHKCPAAAKRNQGQAPPAAAPPAAAPPAAAPPAPQPTAPQPPPQPALIFASENNINKTNNTMVVDSKYGLLQQLEVGAGGATTAAVAATTLAGVAAASHMPMFCVGEARAGAAMHHHHHHHHQQLQSAVPQLPMLNLPTIQPMACLNPYDSHGAVGHRGFVSCDPSFTYKQHLLLLGGEMKPQLCEDCGQAFYKRLGSDPMMLGPSKCDICSGRATTSVNKCFQ